MHNIQCDQSFPYLWKQKTQNKKNRKITIWLFCCFWKWCQVIQLALKGLNSLVIEYLVVLSEAKLFQRFIQKIHRPVKKMSQYTNPKHEIWNIDRNIILSFVGWFSTQSNVLTSVFINVNRSLNKPASLEKWQNINGKIPMFPFLLDWGRKPKRKQVKTAHWLIVFPHSCQRKR